MKDKLKEEVAQAETKEENMELIEKAGVAMTDDELEKVAGGIRTGEHLWIKK